MLAGRIELAAIFDPERIGAAQDSIDLALADEGDDRGTVGGVDDLA